MGAAMIRCRTVAELLTSDRLQSENFWRRLEVRLHLRMCRYCARLARQIRQLRPAALRMAALTDAEKTGGDGDSEDLEGRLLRKLSDKN